MTMSFHGVGVLAGVEFTPDLDDDEPEPQPRGPHTFDWCGPGRTAQQHRACHKTYRTTRDTNLGRGRPNLVPTDVVCECPCHKETP